MKHHLLITINQSWEIKKQYEIICTKIPIKTQILKRIFLSYFIIDSFSYKEI